VHRGHQDWLVVTADGDWLVLAELDESDDVAGVAVGVAVVVALVFVVDASVVFPMGPSKTMTAQARAKAASVAATTRRRMRLMRSARAARSARPAAARSVGCGVVMTPS
jgi:hypothetical protein